MTITEYVWMEYKKRYLVAFKNARSLVNQAHLSYQESCGQILPRELWAEFKLDCIIAESYKDFHYSGTLTDIEGEIAFYESITKESIDQRIYEWEISRS